MTGSRQNPEEPAPQEERRQRGRPPKIDQAKLLKVAREVFLEHGIRATTAEVAERAQVSEGSIFYRFKSKEALFSEAMQIAEGDVPELLMQAVAGIKEGDLEDALIELAHALVGIAKVGLPLMMMSWSNPQSGPCANKTNTAKFREFVTKLAGFFQRHIDSGRLRSVDPEILARTFLGSIHHYCMGRMFADEHGILMIPEGMFIRGHVDLLLRGVLLDTEMTSSPYRRRAE
jgi:AcrR family transcriptional regulator